MFLQQAIVFAHKNNSNNNIFVYKLLLFCTEKPTGHIMSGEHTKYGNLLNGLIHLARGVMGVPFPYY
jgi:hypothetical protein